MAAQMSPLLLARLSEFVEARLGLQFPRGRWPDLERGLRAAAPELGYADAEAGLRQLLIGPVSRRQIEILASQLTVGETYFFREGPSYTALKEHLLPALIAERRGRGRHLRLWSAGCCTGEEPYSLAILLSRLLPDLPDWNITLLATDINPVFLEKAAAGVFGEWSFRNAPPWLRAGYFAQTPTGRWAILPQIKQMVTFASLNLAEEVYPSPRHGVQAMDVILCRNVLIYMAPAQAKTVVDKFFRTLTEGGCLSVSPAETSAPLFAAYAAASYPGATFYRKGAPTGPEPAVVPARGRPTRPLRPAPVAPPAPPPEDPARLARACANAGRLTEGLVWCDQAIAADKINPLGHYLRATILQEQGALEEAARSLRHALYLDPEFVLAHFALGSLARRLGQASEAEKHLANALRLLRDCRPSDPVPEAEGLTAGRLSEIIESMQGDGTTP